PGVSVDVISPADYERTDRSGYNLEIFHFSTPAVLPRNPALFVLPPDNSLVELARPISRPVVSSRREPHPLTRYINFTLLRPAYVRSGESGRSPFSSGFRSVSVLGAREPPGFDFHVESLGLVL